MTDFLRNLIPDSNRLELAFANHNNQAGNLLAACYAEGSGFVGAFGDTDVYPDWARRAHRYLVDEFHHDTPGRIKFFSQMEPHLGTGDGECHVNCRHALELWKAQGSQGIEPFSLFQDYGSCVDASAAEGSTSLIGVRAANPANREVYRHSCGWYWYADRGYCGDGWSGAGCATVALRRGLAFRVKYDLAGNTVDFTDDDKNEQIVARQWCRAGIPAWLSSYTQANHAFEDGAITEFDGRLPELRKVFAAGGYVHTGGTRTSGGSKPFTPGRVGPHMQSGYGYDDSDQFRQFCMDVLHIAPKPDDFPVIMGQTWGSGWSGECADQWWPSWWGPKPQGAWVCWASWLLDNLAVEYAWLPLVKGFPGGGPAPQPEFPKMLGNLRAEQAGAVIAIRGEINLTLDGKDYPYIVVPNQGQNTYGVIPKPVV